MKLIKERHLAYDRHRCVGWVSGPHSKFSICWCEHLGMCHQVTSSQKGLMSLPTAKQGGNSTSRLELDDFYVCYQLQKISQFVCLFSPLELELGLMDFCLACRAFR